MEGPLRATRIDPRKVAADLAWALAFAYSFAPFDFTLAPNRITSAFALSKPLTLEYGGILTLHALAFAAVGAADRLGSAERDPGGWIFPPVLARGFLFCMIVEVGQVFVPSRHPEVADLATNLVGLLLGHASVRAISRLGFRIWTDARLPRVRWVGLALWGLFWSSLVLLPARFVTLDDWDRTYPLVIGNEKGGERAWEGELQYVAVYDRALGADEVRSSLDLEPGIPGTTAARRNMGLVLAYDFTHPGQLEVNPEGELADPGLRIGLPARTQWSDGHPPALVLDETAFLASAAPAARLSTRIASTGSFSVEVWCRPAMAPRTEPARIIGISHDVYARNFGLGLQGKALYFRVRNRLNEPGGSQFELRAEQALSGAALQDGPIQFVATYAQGVSSIFRNGRRLSPTVDLREPGVLLGFGARPAGHLVTALVCGSAWSLSGPAS
jgi:hypothetical protein